MKRISAPLQQRTLRVYGMVVVCVMAAGFLNAQTLRPRITSEVTSSQTAQLPGSLHPLARAENDAGRMPGGTRLNGVSIYFNRSAAQQADLNALLAAQQDPSSAQYHQWLTPDQFAARFGMAQSDIDKVQTWLQQQGFSVDSVARSHNMIRFSGTVSQLESAFNTQLHYYNVGGVRHFAPSTALSVPSAIASSVSGIHNLNDFRPRAQYIKPRPGFTSGLSGNVYFAPADIVTTYDLAPLTSGGVNGAGQAIAIIGQSAIVASDIESFQSAAGLPTKDPTMVLVPGTGASLEFSGDESESDLDVEWSGAMAPGASILFVYTGDSFNNSGVFDALQYAIDEALAPIISLSYDSCETELTASNFTTFEGWFQQAATQGQTVVVASGDQGSTACAGDTALTTAQQEALAVNYPASSAYVVAMGGTEITAANSTSSNSTYWNSSSGSDVTPGSVKTYIPEIAWNDDSSQFGLGASGGGASATIARPSWQTGVSGIASGSTRLVPDISLYSSSSFPGYLYCTSDQSAWATNSSGAVTQAASCNSGFRDAATGDLTAAGGTSFATPIFAGMVALLNQDLKYTKGQGLINPTLYKLAANSTTYAAAFHDVTTGNNNCTAGTTYCGSNTGGFSAGTGYDEVTGLGSVDLAKLALAWGVNTASSASLIGTTTTVQPPANPATGSPQTFTITVTGVNGGTPTGSVNLSIDGGTSSGGSSTSVTLGSGGVATYQTTFTTPGLHEVVAAYQGTGTFAPSTSSASITITPYSITSTPSTLTVSQGSKGTETISVTPQNGYNGTLELAIDFGSDDTTLQNLCVAFATTNTQGFGTLAVSGTSALTTTLVLDTNPSDCSTTGASVNTGTRAFKNIPHGKAATNKSSNPVPAAVTLAGLLLAGFFGRRRRFMRNLVAVLAIAAAGLAISACGGGSSSSSSSGGTGSVKLSPPKGTYTGTIFAEDQSNASIASQPITFTFTID